jgi:hypothetical protein
MIGPFEGITSTQRVKTQGRNIDLLATLHHQTQSDFVVGQIPFLEWKRPGFAAPRRISEQPEERFAHPPIQPSGA